MLDVWTELQHVRKQFAELRNSTERDLDAQRAEFARVIRNITGLTTKSIGAGDVCFQNLTNIHTDRPMHSQLE